MKITTRPVILQLAIVCVLLGKVKNSTKEIAEFDGKILQDQTLVSNVEYPPNDPDFNICSKFHSYWMENENFCQTVSSEHFLEIVKSCPFSLNLLRLDRIWQPAYENFSNENFVSTIREVVELRIANDSNKETIYYCGMEYSVLELKENVAKVLVYLFQTWSSLKIIRDASKIDENATLQEISLMNLMEKSFGLFLGDFTLRRMLDSNGILESGDFSPSSLYFMNLLKVAIKRGSFTATDQSLLIELHGKIVVLNQISHFYDELQILVIILDALIKNLKKNDYLLIPYGWKTPKLSHAMFLIVERTENEELVMKIGNSGGGVDFHHKKRFGQKFKVFPLVQTKPFSYEQMVKTNFLQAMAALFSIHSDLSESATQNDVYGIVFSRFGWEEFNKISKSDDMYRLPQFSSTCTMSSIFSFLRVHLPLSVYKKAKFIMAVEAIKLMSLKSKISLVYAKLALRFARFYLGIATRDFSENEEAIKDLEICIMMLAETIKSLSSSEKIIIKSLKQIQLPHQIKPFNFKGSMADAASNSDMHLFMTKNLKPTNPDELVEFEHILESMKSLKSPIPMSYGTSLLMNLPLTFSPVQNGLECLFSLRRIAILYLEIQANEQYEFEMVAAAIRLFAVAIKCAFEYERQTVPELAKRLETYGIANTIFNIHEESLFNFPCSIKTLEHIKESLKLMTADGDGALLAIENYAQICVSYKRCYAYLVANDSPSDNQLLAEVANLKPKYLHKVDFNTLRLHFLITKGSLPMQYYLLHDIRILLHSLLIKTSVSSNHILKYFKTLERTHKSDLNFLVLQNVHKLVEVGSLAFPMISYNNISFNYQIENYFRTVQLDSRSTEVLKKQGHLIEKNIMKSSFSYAAVVSYYQNNGPAVVDYDSQVILYLSLMSITKSFYYNISLAHLSPVLNFVDSKLKKLELHLDSIYLELSSSTFNSTTSWYDQYLYFMMLKIELACFKQFYSASSGDGDESYKHLVEARQKIQGLLDSPNEIKDLSADSMKFYLLSLKILSYQNFQSDEDVQAILLNFKMRARLQKRYELLFQMNLRIDHIYRQAILRILDKPQSELLLKIAKIVASEKNDIQVDDIKVSAEYLSFKSGKNLYKFWWFIQKSTVSNYPLYQSAANLDYPILKELVGDSIWNGHKDSYNPNLMIFELTKTQLFVDFSQRDSLAPRIAMRMLEDESTFILLEDSMLQSIKPYPWFAQKFIWKNEVSNEYLFFSREIISNPLCKLTNKPKFDFFDNNGILELAESLCSTGLPNELDEGAAVFLDQDMVPRRIYFDKLVDSQGRKLEFSPKGNNDATKKLYWTANPKYYMIEGETPFPKDFFSYILLSDGESETFLVLPLKSKSDLVSKNSSYSGSFDCMTVPVNKDKIFASTARDLLYLSYLFMVLNEFEVSWEYLSKIAVVEPFTNEELKYAAWIFTFSTMDTMHQPEIYALQSYVSLLVYKNSMMFPRQISNSSLTNEISSLYDQASLFELFWCNKAPIKFPDGVVDKYKSIAASVLSRYYEVRESLSPEMIFYQDDGGSPSAISLFLESRWLSSLGAAQARLNHILGISDSYPEKINLDFTIDFTLIKNNFRDIYLKNTGFSHYKNLLDDFSMIYSSVSPGFCLRQDILMVNPLFHSYMSNIYIALTTNNPSDRSEILQATMVALKDSYFITNSTNKAIIHLLLYLVYSALDQSQKCDSALNNFMLLWTQRNLFSVEASFNELLNSCRVKSVVDFATFDYTGLQTEALVKFGADEQVASSKDFLDNLDFSSLFDEFGLFQFCYLNIFETASIIFTKNSFEIFRSYIKSLHADRELKIASIEKAIEEKLTLKSKLKGKIISQAWKKPSIKDLIHPYVLRDLKKYKKYFPHHQLPEIIEIDSLLHHFLLEKTLWIRLSDTLSMLDKIPLNDYSANPLHYGAEAIQLLRRSYLFTQSSKHEFIHHSPKNSYFDNLIRNIQALNEAESSIPSGKDEAVEIAAQAMLLFSKFESPKKMDYEELNSLKMMLPFLLAFEYNSGRTIWNQHILDLLTLCKLDGMGQGLQRMMSSGKTFVLSTLAPLFRAMKGMLSWLIVPKALLRTNAIDINNRTFQFFGLRVFVFQHERDSSFNDTDRLYWMLHTLKEVRNKHEFVITTKEDVQALRNSLIEELSNSSQEKENLKKLSLLVDIFLLLKNNSVALIDEIDWVLDPLSSTRFTLGNPVFPSRVVLRAVAKFFEYVATNVQLNKEFMLTSAAPNTVSSEIYDSYKLVLYDIALKIVKEEMQIDRQSEPNLKDKSSQNILGNDSEKTDFASILSALHASTDLSVTVKNLKLSDPIKEIIVALNRIVNIHLSEALEKKVNEHYGLAIQNFDKIKHAKPYVAAKTPAAYEKSDFSDPLVVITKTFRIYYQMKLTLSQTVKLIENLRRESFSICKRQNYGNLNKCKAGKRFEKCFGLQLFKFSLEDQEKIKFIRNQMTKNCAFPFLNEYLVNEVLISIPKFSSNVCSTSANLMSQFQEISGYSGTIDNPHILPDNLYLHSDETIQQKIQNKLSRNANIFFVDEADGSVEAFFSSLSSLMSTREDYRNQYDRIAALLDLGAQFRNLKNLQVATAILAFYAKFDAVIFFDEEKDALLILKRFSTPKICNSSDMSTILSENSLILDKVFLYLDQRHCIGTDIHLDSYAVGIVTFSDSTYLSALNQGILRMRKFFSGHQEVIFAISVSIKGKLEEKMEESGKQPSWNQNISIEIHPFPLWSYQDLVAIAEFNTKNKNDLQNSQIIAQKSENFIQNSKLLSILSAPISLMKSEFAKYRNILIEQEPVLLIEKYQKTEPKIKLSIEEAKSLEEYKKSLGLPAISLRSNVGEEIEEQLQQSISQQKPKAPCTWYIPLPADPMVLLNALTTESDVGTAFYQPKFSVFKLSSVVNQFPGFSIFEKFWSTELYMTINFASCNGMNVTIFNPFYRNECLGLIVLQSISNPNDSKVYLASLMELEYFVGNGLKELGNYKVFLVNMETDEFDYAINQSTSTEGRDLIISSIVEAYVLAGNLLKLSNPRLINSALRKFSSLDESIAQLLFFAFIAPEFEEKFKDSDFFFKFSIFQSFESFIESHEPRILSSLFFCFYQTENYPKMSAIRRKIQIKDIFDYKKKEISILFVSGLTLYGTNESMALIATIKEFFDFASTQSANEFNQIISNELSKSLNCYLDNSYWKLLLGYLSANSEQNSQLIVDMLNILAFRFNYTQYSCYFDSILSILVSIYGIGTFHPDEWTAKISRIADSKEPNISASSPTVPPLKVQEAIKSIALYFSSEEAKNTAELSIQRSYEAVANCPEFKETLQSFLKQLILYSRNH